ncbi:hypothetical protein O6H91_12G102500 [Diphasiastrum complanatum]|uniref:Uncharacterized protein n=1 Tax=Diphasiastrum complanatum TaxID=34168 RepID=A0ACC2C586_DIPCM|nr:hypothetical protein O6H91_12G102500 [Diphasiastrum complanatum]
MTKGLDQFIQDFHEYLTPLYCEIPPKIQMLMFTDGLPKNYQVNVRRNQPNTLENVIRAATNFDDTPKPPKNHHPNEQKKGFQFKRKDKKVTYEASSNPNSKKPKHHFNKHQNGKKDLAEARKKNLCFKCNGEGHLARDCVKNKASTSCIISQSNEMDTCFLSSMFYGPNDLIWNKGKIGGRVVNVLFDRVPLIIL